MDIVQTNGLVGRFDFIIKNTDVAMGFATMCIIMVMIIPIPTMPPRREWNCDRIGELIYLDFLRILV